MRKKLMVVGIGLLIIISVIISYILWTAIKDSKKSNIPVETNTQKILEEKKYVNIDSEVFPAFFTLMFHEISPNNIEGTTTITEEKFEEILKYLYNNEYNFLTAKEVYNFMINKTQIPEKSVWLTFDDNLKNIHRIGTPLLKKYKAHATCFVEIRSIGMPLRLTKRDLISMKKSNIWDIQSHGYNGHQTPFIDQDGNSLNFYFNRQLIGDTHESDVDFKNRIKKDIERSFHVLQSEYDSDRLFFAYPIDYSDAEDAVFIKLIESCLDELNVIGIGVKGNGRFPIDWSTSKHKIARYGIRNTSNIDQILSLNYLGKRISYKTDWFINLTQFKNEQYLTWRDNEIILLDKYMKVLDTVKIKFQKDKGFINHSSDICIAAEPKGSIWLADKSKGKLYELTEKWVLKREFNIANIPVTMWVKNRKLFFLDTQGKVMSFDKGIEKLEFKPQYNVKCIGGSVWGDIVYISDFRTRKIIKVNYINKMEIDSKYYKSQYKIVPLISDRENQIVAKELYNNVLVRVKY